MITIRYANIDDKAFWFNLDKHLDAKEYDNKINNHQAYILFDDDIPIGILRYNLFWDNIPFCTVIYIDPRYQNQGYGSILMKYWEDEMRNKSYDIVLTSTQVDENAQHFYRKLGYKDCGGLIIDTPKHRQAMELFMIKSI